MKEPKHPTKQTYSRLDQAYDHLNATLFSGLLPACLITWQRQRGAYGYFSPAKFRGMYDNDETDEIALNPAKFEGTTQRDILGTLAHEMVHCWQRHHGRPPRKSYHNREWASKMREIGLIPSNTGKPGGKETGQRMDHYIDEHGTFSHAANEILENGPVVQHQDQVDDATRKKKAASKTKYSCPTCDLNAWAKPEANLWCGDCEEPMKPEIRDDENA